MSTRPNIDLTKVVNASGFVFQLGVEHAIASSTPTHGWEVEAREHPWRLGEDEGFIDIVLSDGWTRGVVECKRTRDASWIFLVAEPAMPTRRMKLCWLQVEEGKGALFGWDDFRINAESYESSFCIMRGQGENDTPLLERMSSKLVRSVDALACEEAPLLPPSGQNDVTRLFVPVIITTAQLFACKVSPRSVDLTSGTIQETNFEQVSFIRFCKGLATEHSRLDPPARGERLAMASGRKERSVMVVNADAIPQALAGWDVDTLRRRDAPPWEVLRARRGERRP